MWSRGRFGVAGSRNVRDKDVETSPDEVHTRTGPEGLVRSVTWTCNWGKR